MTKLAEVTGKMAQLQDYIGRDPFEEGLVGGPLRGFLDALIGHKFAHIIAEGVRGFQVLSAPCSIFDFVFLLGRILRLTLSGKDNAESKALSLVVRRASHKLWSTAMNNCQVTKRRERNKHSGRTFRLQAYTLLPFNCYAFSLRR